MARGGSVRRSLRRLLADEGPRDLDIRVGDEMTENVVTAHRDDTLRSAARAMAEPDVGSAIVSPVEGGVHPGILTVRDILEVVAAGHDPDTERVGDHGASEAICVEVDASLAEAAEKMASRRFRHLVVVDAEETVGVLSMRDVLGSWVREGATPRGVIPIRAAMHGKLIRFEGDRTLLHAARAMVEEEIGAVVVDRGGTYPGVVTEREVAHSVGAGADPAEERVLDRLASRMTFSAPEWSLRQAAEAMIKGRLQDVVVVDRRGPIGVIAMRDIVGAWLEPSSDPA
jgi:CBS domain-containing protein